jgi:hypothetical protein
MAVVSTACGRPSEPTDLEGAKRRFSRVAFGRFEGERWRLSVYGDCFRLLAGDDKIPRPFSRRCADADVDPDDYLSGSISIDGPRRTLFVGSALRAVRSIGVRIKNGDSFGATIIRVPKRKSAWNYYVLDLPTGARGQRVARNGLGRVLERDKLFENSNR